MRVLLGVLLIAASLALSACSKHSDLPPAPVLAPGEGFKNASGFSTERMLALCDGVISASATGKLQGFSDAAIANGTCEMGAVAVELIGRREDQGQHCAEATRLMIGEFRQRFPDHNPQEVIGRC